MSINVVSAETLSDTGDYGGWALGPVAMTAIEKWRALHMSMLSFDGEPQGPCSRWPMSWWTRLFRVR